MNSDPTTYAPGVASHALFAVGDVVEITADCMTKGKLATVAEHYFGKIEVSFSPQWCGWYLPEQLRKISSANDQGMAAARCGLNKLGGLSPSPSPPCSIAELPTNSDP